MLSLLLTLATLHGTPAQVGIPAAKAPPECELSWTGRYKNGWGFEVTIPPGRTGYPNSPVAGCGDEMVIMGDHGIVIPLSSEPYDRERHIEVYAGYNSLELAADRDAIEDWLGGLRARAAKGTVRTVGSRGIALAGLRGSRIIAHYQERDSRQPMVEERLEFLRRRDRRESGPSYTFTVYLRTPATTYAADRRVFDAFLATLRFTAPRR